jgi:hypothetical protein
MSEDKFSIEGMDDDELEKIDANVDKLVVSEETEIEIEGMLTPMDELTLSINEVYQSYKRAGFNTEQAFELTTIHLERALDMMELEGEI